MFGISVYFQDLDLDYIRYANSLGANMVFTSLHIPEEDLSNVEEKIVKVLELCKELEMELIPDISPLTFSKLNLAENDFMGLWDLGFKTVRLDFGFDDLETVKNISEIFKIMINASTISPEYLDKAKEYGISIDNFILSHNFYPKAGTGLRVEDFIKLNKDYERFNLMIQAFVPGDKLRRFPIYEGLPTLEKHRNYNPFVAAVEMIKKYHAPYVIIGDSLASKESLNFIKEFIKDGHISVKAHLNSEYKYLYNKKIKIRNDVGENALRLKIDRKPGIKPKNNYGIKIGNIGIDNELYGRYCGEFQIFTKNLESDSRINIIGFVDPEFIKLLDVIDGNDTIIFKPLD